MYSAHYFYDNKNDCFVFLNLLCNVFFTCMIIIGASLSEPHTNRVYEKIAVLLHVCMCVSAVRTQRS